VPRKWCLHCNASKRQPYEMATKMLRVFCACNVLLREWTRLSARGRKGWKGGKRRNKESDTPGRLPVTALNRRLPSATWQLSITEFRASFVSPRGGPVPTAVEFGWVTLKILISFGLVKHDITLFYSSSCCCNSRGRKAQTGGWQYDIYSLRSFFFYLVISYFKNKLADDK
jgi:hypothetical protein